MQIIRTRLWTHSPQSKNVVRPWLYLSYIQLTFEQYRFELLGPTYTQIFFKKYVLPYYMIQGWLNLRMWKCAYGGPTVKLHVEGMWVSAPNPGVQGSAVLCRASNLVLKVSENVRQVCFPFLPFPLEVTFMEQLQYRKWQRIRVQLEKCINNGETTFFLLD